MSEAPGEKLKRAILGLGEANPPGPGIPLETFERLFRIDNENEALNELRHLRTKVRDSTDKIFGRQRPERGRPVGSLPLTYLEECRYCATAVDLCALTVRKAQLAAGAKDSKWISRRVARGRELFQKDPALLQRIEQALARLPEFERPRHAELLLKNLAKKPKPSSRPGTVSE